MGYILRVTVKVLGKAPISELELEQHFWTGEYSIKVKQRWPFLTLTSAEFATEAEAEKFVPRIKLGLYSLALTHNISFKPDFSRRTISRSNDPVLAAENLARSFGLELDSPVKPVHGISENYGYVIFESGENIKFLSMGSVEAYVSTPWSRVEPTISRAIAAPHSASSLDGDSLATAIELYLASFYESSLRARFLTLITVLEVLSPKSLRHPKVTDILCTLSNEIDRLISEVSDPEELDALNSLQRELEFKNETSIRRRIRRLVLDELAVPEEERAILSQKVVKAYDFRSTIVHSGSLDELTLSNAFETILEVVKVLLCSRLGLPFQ